MLRKREEKNAFVSHNEKNDMQFIIIAVLALIHLKKN